MTDEPLPVVSGGAAVPRRRNRTNRPLPADAETYELVLQEIGRLLQPLVRAAEDGRPGIEHLFAEAGIDEPPLSESDWDRIDEAVTAVEAVWLRTEALLDGDLPDIDDIEELADVDELLDVLGDALAEIVDIEPVIAEVEEAVDGLTDLDSVVEEAEEAYAEIVDLESAIDGFVDATVALADPAELDDADDRPDIGSVYADVEDAVGDLTDLDSLVDDVDDAVGAIAGVEVAFDDLDDAVSAITDVDAGDVDGLETLQDDLVDAHGQLDSLARPPEEFADLVDDVDELVDDLDDAVSAITGLESAAADVGDALATLPDLESVIDGLDDGVGAIASLRPLLDLDDVGETLSEFEAVLEEVEEVADDVSDLENVGDAIDAIASLRTVADEVEEAADTVAALESVIGVVDDAREEADDFDDLLSDLDDAGDAIAAFDSVADDVTDAVDAVTDLQDTTLVTDVDALRTDLDTAIDELTAVDATYDQSDELDDLLAGLVDVTTDLEALDTDAVDDFDVLLSDLADPIDALEDAFDELAGLEGAVSDLDDAYDDVVAVDAVVDAAGEAVGELVAVDDVEDRVSEAYDELVDVDGVIAALEDVYDDLTDVESASDEVVAAVEASLDVRALSAELGVAGAAVADLQELVEAVVDAYEAITDLDEIDLGEAVEEVDGTEMGTLLVQHLVVDYLETHRERIYAGLTLLGVVEESVDGPTRLHLDRVGDLFTDPGTIPAKALGWRDQEFRADVVLECVRRICLATGLVPATSSAPLDTLTAVAGVEDAEDLTLSTEPHVTPRSVRIPVLRDEDGSMGMALLAIPGTTTDHEYPGLAAIPFAQTQLEASETFDLGDDWRFEFESSLDPELGDVAIRFLPSDDGLSVDVVGLDGDVVETSFRLAAGIVGDFEYQEGSESDDEESELVLFGDEGGTRFSLLDAGASIAVRSDGEEADVRVEAPASAVLKIDAEEFDSFLGEVMPEDGIDADFETTVGWSSTEGLYFGGGGTMDATLPVDKSLGPVTIEEILVSLGVWAGDDAGEDEDLSITATGAATVAIDIGGVIHGRVENIGVETTLAIPDDGDGEYGPLDLDVGFRPPDGISVSVDLDAIGGEGYLYYEPEEGRYEGFLQLTVGDLVLTAFGILQTDLDDGDGYSLLVLISGEFQPIQLGMGFTLSGVGGLLGLHRAIDADALEGAVSSGGVGSILFPENPAENAPELISDLKTFFPIKRDNYVFGPMAQIGWGSPQIIEADLAVVMDVPVEDIVLLGSVTTELPNVADDPDSSRPISLTMDFAGGYTISERRLWFRGALRDSNILMWDVEGGIALEQRSGDVSRFILSIGGFHDEYEPPDDFEVPDRIRFSMSALGGRAGVELEAFFALTTNTVQAGASIEAHLDLSIAEIIGRLWFDTLIQFDPFEFVANLGASLEVDTTFGTASIGFEGNLSGPNPYHVRGEVDLPIGSKSVEVTFGDEEGTDDLPPADVLSELVEDLEERNNWSAQRGDSGSQLVTVREVEDEDSVIVHPLGRLSVRQTIVPLETRIETFGEARPEPHTKFDVTGAELIDPAAEDDGEGGEEPTDGIDLDLPEAVEEEFAPAAFEEMSNDEKLEAEPTERKPAGRRMAPAETADGREEACQRAFVYDELIEDEAEHAQPLELGHARATIESAVSEIGSLETEAVANAGEYGKYTNPREAETFARETIDAVVGDVDDPADEEPTHTMTMMQTSADDDGSEQQPTVGMREPAYVIVDADDLVPVRFEGSPAEPTSRASAKRALRRLERRDPAAAERLTIVTADRASRPDGASDAETEVVA